MLAEHDCRLGACTCVGVCGVTSPSREFSKTTSETLFSYRTGAGNKEHACTAAPTPGKHQNPPFDSVEDNIVEVDQEGRRLVLYIEQESLKLSLATGQTKFGSIFITFKRN